MSRGPAPVPVPVRRVSRSGTPARRHRAPGPGRAGSAGTAGAGAPAAAPAGRCPPPAGAACPAPGCRAAPAGRRARPGEVAVRDRALLVPVGRLEGLVEPEGRVGERRRRRVADDGAAGVRRVRGDLRRRSASASLSHSPVAAASRCAPSAGSHAECGTRIPTWRRSTSTCTCGASGWGRPVGASTMSPPLPCTVTNSRAGMTVFAPCGASRGVSEPPSARVRPSSPVTCDDDLSLARMD